MNLLPLTDLRTMKLLIVVDKIAYLSTNANTFM